MAKIQHPENKSDRIPPQFIALGGISFVLALIVSPWIAVVGVIGGIYMLAKYPQKKIHGLIALVLNLLVLIFIPLLTLLI